MGQLTRAQIVSEGLLAAGDTSLTARANLHLNARLRSLYKGWAWPQLQKRASAIALAQGTTSLAIGAGTLVTLEIKQIYSPIWVYSSDYSVKNQAEIAQYSDTALVPDDVINDPTANTGIPQRFKVEAGTVWGRWNLRPTPVPDRALLLSIKYQEQPADIDVTSAGNSTVPAYPNDATLIQAVVMDAYRHMYGVDSTEYQAAAEEYGASVQRDRSDYGSIPGINDLLGLDPSVFF